MDTGIPITIKLYPQEDKKMRISKFPKSLTIALSKETYQAIKSISDAMQIAAAELTRELIQDGLEVYHKRQEKQSE